MRFGSLNSTQQSGREQAGLRPIVIISGNSMNQNSSLCLACPLSSKIKNYPATLLLKKNNQNGLTAESEILIFQIRVLDQSRLTKRIGAISEIELKQIITELNGIFEL